MPFHHVFLVSVKYWKKFKSALQSKARELRLNDLGLTSGKPKFKSKILSGHLMIIISIIIFVIIMRIILWFRQMSLTIKSLNIKTVNVEIMNFGVTSKRRSSCFVWDKQGSPANKCLLLLRCLRVFANKFYWKKFFDFEKVAIFAVFVCLTSV